MKLKLTRPLCTIDLETTGTKVDTDRIVQISIIKLYPDDRPREVKTRYINPEMPIPAEATDIHHITNEIVKDQPTFKQIAKGLYEFIKGCDIASYNGNTFDIPLLYNEFWRAGFHWNTEDILFIDACSNFKIKEGRALEDAVLFYCGDQHVNAHDAQYDAEATLSVLEGQLEMYGDLAEMSIEELALFSNYGNKRADIHNKFVVNQNGEYVVNFGQHIGKLAKDEIGFINWMTDPQRNFSPDTLRICKIILDAQKEKERTEKFLSK